MEDKHPTWLKVMQNGALGEARSKAFLINRFWVLERSVDIEGADFIIQRRLTNKNLLDRDPPRFGVVQTKFFESHKTTQYIPNEYIVDKENNVREDFFLLCHTGNEENSKTYFLTSKDIRDNFPTLTDEGFIKYRLYGNEIMNSNRYLIISNKHTLDRMENQLIATDFIKNREFISLQLPDKEIDINKILPDFKEPIDNWWGDIPIGFKEFKETALYAITKIDQISNKLKVITNEVDPIKAFEEISDIEYFCKDGSGKWSISLPNNLYDEEFESACQNHLEKVDLLRKDGLLDNFIKAKQTIKEQVFDFIWEKLPINSNIVHRFILEFSISDFTIETFNHTLIDEKEYFPELEKLDSIERMMRMKTSGVKPISKLKFECYWKPGIYYIEDEFKNDLNGFYKTEDFSIYHECMDKLFENKYNKQD